MRQVPHYLLIGNGRVAQHFQYYFSLLQLPFSTWHRQKPQADLQLALTKASHILVLISDAAIEEFITTHCLQHTVIKIHFSGSLVSELAYGAHPLMTFAPQLYTLEQYQSIPFVLDEHAPNWQTFLPGVPNQHVRLQRKLKAKYHALCVLSGNFSCLLWQKLFSSLENEFQIPSSIAIPYLQQQMQNLQTNPASALTGPLMRGDTATIAKNINALQSDPFLPVYESFVAAYQNIAGNSK